MSEWKQVTIVGKGESWQECQFNTPEIWGTATCLVHAGMRDKPFTKVFAFDSRNSLLIEALEIARERNIPVVSTLEYATEPYPTREVVKDFKVAYFKNTASYMLAMAIYQKFDRMWVYGLEQNAALNYVLIRPWVTFWFGVAYGRNIDIRFGKGVLNWQYKSLGLKQFMTDEKYAEMEEYLGYKIQG